MTVSDNLSDAEQRDILALLLALALLWRMGDWVGRLYANWRIRESSCIATGADGANGARRSRLRASWGRFGGPVWVPGYHPGRYVPSRSTTQFCCFRSIARPGSKAESYNEPRKARVHDYKRTYGQQPFRRKARRSASFVLRGRGSDPRRRHVGPHTACRIERERMLYRHATAHFHGNTLPASASGMGSGRANCRGK